MNSPLTKDNPAVKVWKNAHAGGVEDVSCHMIHQNRWASVGNDGCLKFWDCRKEDCTSSVKAHGGVDVATVDFNPFLEYLVATGADDGVITRWDTRKLGAGLHQLKHHAKDQRINRIAFNPHIETLLASCSSDRRCIVWDLGRIGADTKNTSLQFFNPDDGPPEYF